MQIQFNCSLIMTSNLIGNKSMASPKKNYGLSIKTKTIFGHTCRGIFRRWFRVETRSYTSGGKRYINNFFSTVF
jgi:hypothetical protein